MTYIPDGYTVIGTCSECGGPVAKRMPTITRPTARREATCLECGAVRYENYGPTIPMRRLRRRFDWGNLPLSYSPQYAGGTDACTARSHV